MYPVEDKRKIYVRGVQLADDVFLDESIGYDESGVLDAESLVSAFKSSAASERSINSPCPKAAKKLVVWFASSSEGPSAMMSPRAWSAVADVVSSPASEEDQDMLHSEGELPALLTTDHDSVSVIAESAGDSESLDSILITREAKG
jgi:hypothetical protein